MTHRFIGTLPPDTVPVNYGLWVSQDGMIFKAVRNARALMYHVLNVQKDGSISITTDKGRVKVSAARIIAEAFIPNPGRFSRVHHIDNDPTNNAVSNLRWGEAPIEDKRAARRQYYTTHKDIFYKANRKSGHTHNCYRNCLKREYRARGRGDIFDLLFSPENIREASEEEWDDDAVAHFRRMLGGEEPWLKPAP